MSEAKSLLAMVGADMSPGKLSNAAVVMIDCQNEYVDGFLPLTGIGPALDQCSALLAKARATGTPIVHVVHQGQAGGAFDLDGHGGQIASQAAAEDGEPIVKKPLPNGFAKTELHEVLQDIGRKEIIMAGFQTHMCISSTARAALDLGFRMTIVDTATATRDLPRPGGGVMKAEELHVASLAALGDRFAIIAPDVDAIPEN
ncbi:MAG: cysteine hydrolase family protein [Hyphomicrobiales bacterium]